MSKNFYENIIKEINRREKERVEQERREEEERKNKEKIEEELEIKKIKRRIFESFVFHLKVLLKDLKNYDGHHILYTSEIPFSEILVKSAKELGFTICPLHDGMDGFYLAILEDLNTPAQKHLSNFDKKLYRAKVKRMNKVLEECQKIRKIIDDGKFEYQIKGIKNGFRLIIIKVKSTKRIDTEFENEIVKKYFDKYELVFIESNDSNDSNEWSFMLKSI